MVRSTIEEEDLDAALKLSQRSSDAFNDHVNSPVVYPACSTVVDDGTDHLALRDATNKQAAQLHSVMSGLPQLAIVPESPSVFSLSICMTLSISRS